MWMFIRAIFIIAPNRKQPKCSSTGDWLNKQWYIHAMDYFLSNEKETNCTKQTRWISNSLGKEARLNGYLLYDFTNLTFWKGKTIKTENISVVSRGWHEGRDYCNEAWEYFLEWNCSMFSLLFWLHDYIYVCENLKGEFSIWKLCINLKKWQWKQLTEVLEYRVLFLFWCIAT